MKKKKQKNKTKTFSVKEVSIIMVLTILVGIFIGVSVGYTIRITFSYNKYSSNYEEIIDTYQNIKSNYYKEIDDNDLLDAAVSGMVKELNDENSEFFPAKDNVDSMLENEYIGIGCSIKEENGNIVIAEVYKKTPAYSKLQKNDILLRVNDKEIRDMSLNDVALLISGKENTKVKITIQRNKKQETYTLKRTKIENHTVTSEEKGNIGIIKVESFTENTTKQFTEKLSDLENKNIKKIILDLRNNAGGYISSAGDIAALFLKKGQIIYQLEKKGLKSNVKDTTKECKDLKVLVLVNHATASSAEVLTSALQEQYGAQVVGEKTYGKGSIQKIYTLSNGSSYKYTIEKWNTSKGKTVDKKGITPDIIVKDDPKTEEDEQLLKALDLLK